MPEMGDAGHNRRDAASEDRVTDQGDDIEIADAPEESRYEARVGADLAGILRYELHDSWIVLVHTEVQPAFEGRGIGSRLAKTALDDARRRGLAVTPQCPFVLSYVRRHREYRDLIVGMRGPNRPPASA
jgi:predicted GNAT family acetyltransferase